MRLSGRSVRRSSVPLRLSVESRPSRLLPGRSIRLLPPITVDNVSATLQMNSSTTLRKSVAPSTPLVPGKALEPSTHLGTALLAPLLERECSARKRFLNRSNGQHADAHSYAVGGESVPALAAHPTDKRERHRADRGLAQRRSSSLDEPRVARGGWRIEIGTEHCVQRLHVDCDSGARSVGGRCASAFMAAISTGGMSSRTRSRSPSGTAAAWVNAVPFVPAWATVADPAPDARGGSLAARSPTASKWGTEDSKFKRPLSVTVGRPGPSGHRWAALDRRRVACRRCHPTPNPRRRSVRVSHGA